MAAAPPTNRPTAAAPGAVELAVTTNKLAQLEAKVMEAEARSPKSRRETMLRSSTCRARAIDTVQRLLHFGVEYASMAIAMLAFVSLPRDLMALLHEASDTNGILGGGKKEGNNGMISTTAYSMLWGFDNMDRAKHCVYEEDRAQCSGLDIRYDTSGFRAPPGGPELPKCRNASSWGGRPIPTLCLQQFRCADEGSAGITLTATCHSGDSRSGGGGPNSEQPWWIGFDLPGLEFWQPLLCWWVNVFVCIVGCILILRGVRRNKRPFGSFRYFEMVVEARRNKWFQRWIMFFVALTGLYAFLLIVVVATGDFTHGVALGEKGLQRILKTEFVLVFAAIVTGVVKAVDRTPSYYDTRDFSDDIMLKLPGQAWLQNSRRVMWRVEILALAFMRTGKAAPLKLLMRVPTDANVQKFCAEDGTLNRKLQAQAKAEATRLAKMPTSVACCGRCFSKTKAAHLSDSMKRLDVKEAGK